jgi:GTP:adenosylcobinamide-phosphate guanylyltransferase
MNNQFDVLVLAGERHKNDNAVAKSDSVACKAFAQVNGKPMIDHVIGTIQESGLANDIVVSISRKKDISMGAPYLSGQIDTKKVIQSEPDVSPVKSAIKMLGCLDGERPILLTTADHALLSIDMIKQFIEGYKPEKFDAAVALLPLNILTKKYPDIKRTRLKFQDGDYKSCNLFIFSDKESAQSVLSFWHIIEDQRKSPWKIAKTLGMVNLLRYLTGFLPLNMALSSIGEKAGVSPQAVMLDIAESAIDVDTPSDLEWVRALSIQG